MEECSVWIETTKSAEDKTSRWFDLPIDYELFRDLFGVEADSKDYQITDMKHPFAGDIVRTTSVKRLNKLYFAYTDLSPEVQQAYKELIHYCSGVEDLLQKSEEFLFYPECHNIMDVARYRLEHNIEFSALSEKGKKYFNIDLPPDSDRYLISDYDFPFEILQDTDLDLLNNVCLAISESEIPPEDISAIQREWFSNLQELEAGLCNVTYHRNCSDMEEPSEQFLCVHGRFYEYNE